MSACPHTDNADKCTCGPDCGCEPATSLRHPQVDLRDTIAMKLLLMARPGAPIWPDDMARAREIVDDLAEYIGPT